MRLQNSCTHGRNMNFICCELRRQVKFKYVLVGTVVAVLTLDDNMLNGGSYIHHPIEPSTAGSRGDVSNVPGFEI